MIGLALIALASCAQDASAATGPRGVSLDRLPAVLEAITETGTLGAGGPAENVTFADLWGQPEARTGRLVRVRGVIRRRFRQGPVGAFPSLSETWITDEKNQPFVLVSPVDLAEPSLGVDVEFTGRFLGLVRYRGADTDRLAPLVAGPDVPEVIPASTSVPSRMPTSSHEWAVGAILAGIAAGMIALAHLRAPRVRTPPPGPPPVFLNPDDDDEDEGTTP